MRRMARLVLTCTPVSRLEAENQALRDKLEKHMEVYSNMLFEVVELKTKIEMVRFAMEDDA